MKSSVNISFLSKKNFLLTFIQLSFLIKRFLFWRFYEYAPVGPQGEILPIAQYTYQGRSTEVLDAEGNKTIYLADSNDRLHAIENYQGNVRVLNQGFYWDTNGNLTLKTTQDHSPNYTHESYAYYKNHNPIQETLTDGKESYTLYRTYSDDGFNLKLAEWDDFGKKITYQYLPGTNLLTREFICEKENLRQRTFCTYDDCAVCIQKIVDDGITENPEDLRGVTTRKITLTHPKQSLPCFGLPEVVEEKTIDPTGTEILRLPHFKSVSHIFGSDSSC